MRIDRFNPKPLDVAADGDKVFYNQMLRRFIETAESLLVLLQHVNKHEDLIQVGEQAHKAIPSFKFFGLETAVQELEKVEHHILVRPDFDVAKVCCRESIPIINDILSQAREALKE